LSDPSLTPLVLYSFNRPVVALYPEIKLIARTGAYTNSHTSAHIVWPFKRGDGATYYYDMFDRCDHEWLCVAAREEVRTSNDSVIVPALHDFLTIVLNTNSYDSNAADVKRDAVDTLIARVGASKDAFNAHLDALLRRAKYGECHYQHVQYIPGATPVHTSGELIYCSHSVLCSRDRLPDFYEAACMLRDAPTARIARDILIRIARGFRVDVVDSDIRLSYNHAPGMHIKGVNLDTFRDFIDTWGM
jgi:hypothetical protein